MTLYANLYDDIFCIMNRGSLQALSQAAMVAYSFKCIKEQETLVQLRLYKTLCHRLLQLVNICQGSDLVLLQPMFLCDH